MLIFLDEYAELVAHFIKFVPAEHVEFVSLPHEDSELGAVAVNAVIILVLHAFDLLVVNFHEDAVFEGICGEIHGCLLWEPFRPLQKPPYTFLNNICFANLSLLLQPKFILKLNPLVLLLECGLELESVDACVIEDGNEFLCVFEVGNAEFCEEVFPDS